MSKTHFRKIKDPNFLGSWDLMNDEGGFNNRVLTIDYADKQTTKDHKGQDTTVAVLHFHDVKPMILNSTNVKMVARVCKSPYIEDWKDKKVEITVRQVKAFGDVHDALRVVNKVIAVKPVDLQPSLSALESASSLEELKIAWTNIPAELKKNKTISSKKEDIKKKLS